MSHRRLLLALAAIFIVKLGVLLQLANHPLLQPGGGLDSDYYYQLAQRAAAGDWLLGPGLYFVSPLYIYFLAVWLAAGASVFVIKLVQITLGTAACGLVWVTARDWFGERAAWLALLMTALTGVLTFYEVVILQAALDPFLTALDLWLVTRALRAGEGALRWSGLAGVALAVHSLNRPNVLVWTVGIALALALAQRNGWRRSLAFAAGVAIAFLPIAARNYAVAGSLTPTPSHGGLNLYIGNNPRADGTYRSVEGITPNIAGQAADARRVAEGEAGRPLSDAEVSTHFARKAMAWMRSAPRDAASLFVRKIAYTLNHSFLTLNYSYPFYRDESLWLRMLGVGPVLLVPLGLLGLFAFRIRGEVRPPGYALFAASVPLLIVSVAVFFVASRYRVPLLVSLCVWSGALLDAVASAAECARSRALAVTLAAVLALGVFTLRDLGLDDGRAEEETRMAVWLVSNGRGADAEERLSRIRSQHPLLGVSHFRVGQAFERAGRPRDALLHYEQAVTIDPEAPEPRVAAARIAGTLGVMLAQRGADDDALRHLSRAAHLAPDDASAQLNLAVQLARMERYAEARASATRALQIDPGYARARAFLATIEKGPRP